ncbi:phosphohydrolase [Rhodoferax lacus]|uniref:Phosphohydrolase n=1 Tax=Rhodoferax lacus TaxID=2184758 RepID=A0A3E1RBY7_9BURK|nr:phosphohydrolase [Rhodoferax lacus]RFO96562.1 phosphohydrolase [Rhodoferax lacus]
MNLIPIEIDSVRIGYPLPCDLVDKDGVLLASKRYVVRSKDDLAHFYKRPGGVFIDGMDADALRKAYVDQLQTLMRKDKSIGEIAGSKLQVDKAVKRTVDAPTKLAWGDLQVQALRLLRDPQSESFAERLDNVHQTLSQESQRNPNGVLFALIQLSASETEMYSATHAMLVSVMCGLAAREVLNWPEPVETLLRKSALTMNIGMTELQDRLTLQKRPPEPGQQALIDAHPQASVELLKALGVSDSTWLEAVAAHHALLPGPLRSKTPAQRLARLIQRADMFAARLSPRLTRPPVSPAVAMQACYFDENKQVDEAGAALIKAVGIYQPGAYVKLASEEVAVVVRRGSNTSTPRVAVVLNRSGMATSEHAVRDTSNKDYRVVASVPHSDVKVQIQLDRLLPLTQTLASDRSW